MPLVETNINMVWSRLQSRIDFGSKHTACFHRESRLQDNAFTGSKRYGSSRTYRVVRASGDRQAGFVCFLTGYGTVLQGQMVLATITRRVIGRNGSILVH